jgi:hypothetical protein
MQLGHFFASQIMIIFSLLILVVFSESRYLPKLLSLVYTSPLVRVSDAKGAFYFLFSFLTTAKIFLLEIIRSTAKICKKDDLKRRTIKSQRLVLYMSFVLFLNFIGAYIFKSLTDRTLNLLVLGLAAIVLTSLSGLAGVDMLMTFYYVIFVLCNILVVLLTYFIGVERVLGEVGRYFGTFRSARYMF